MQRDGARADLDPPFLAALADEVGVVLAAFAGAGAVVVLVDLGAAAEGLQHFAGVLGLADQDAAERGDGVGIIALELDVAVFALVGVGELETVAEDLAFDRDDLAAGDHVLAVEVLVAVLVVERADQALGFLEEGEGRQAGAGFGHAGRVEVGNGRRGGGIRFADRDALRFGRQLRRGAGIGPGGFGLRRGRVFVGQFGDAGGGGFGRRGRVFGGGVRSGRGVGRCRIVRPAAGDETKRGGEQQQGQAHGWLRTGGNRREPRYRGRSAPAGAPAS